MVTPVKKRSPAWLRLLVFCVVGALLYSSATHSSVDQSATRYLLADDAACNTTLDKNGGVIIYFIGVLYVFLGLVRTSSTRLDGEI